MRRMVSESHKQDAPDTMSTSGPAAGCLPMVRVLPERVTMPEQLPYTYVPNYVPDADALFARLREGLDWVHREGTPRLEYYANRHSVPYTYGRGMGRRTYEAQPWTADIQTLSDRLLEDYGDVLDVCFLNRYLNQRDHLGWHADDSPEMSDSRHIAVISLGVEREIWVRPRADREQVSRIRLGHGSLFLMHPGMQDTHEHRIPKAGFECGERISMTYRGYEEPGA